MCAHAHTIRILLEVSLFCSILTIECQYRLSFCVRRSAVSMAGRNSIVCISDPKYNPNANRNYASSANNRDERHYVFGSSGRSPVVLKFSWQYDHFVHRYEPNCGKIPCLDRNVEECFKKSRLRIRNRWLPKFDQFFLVRRHIGGKIFTKIHSVVFT